MRTLTSLLIFLSVPFFATGAVKKTISDGSWYNPSIWSPAGVPLQEDTVIINHDVTITGPYVEFAANWLIIQPTASIVGDTIFALHGNLKLFGDMNLKWIAVVDGDSTLTYGNITAERYVPANVTNYHFSGTIQADTLATDSYFENHGNINSNAFANSESFENHGNINSNIFTGGESFENYGNIINSSIFVPNDSLINHPGGSIVANGRGVFVGYVLNHAGGYMYFDSLTTSTQNLINNGEISCGNWIHGEGIATGTTGKFCIADCFQNFASITGTVDVCDNTPQPFPSVCDINITGTIAPTVTLCAQGPCSQASVSEEAGLQPAVFPNPAADLVTVALKDVHEIEILTSQGVSVRRFSGNNVYHIDLSELANGLYLIRCGSQVTRFIKAK